MSTEDVEATLTAFSHVFNNTANYEKKISIAKVCMGEYNDDLQTFDHFLDKLETFFELVSASSRMHADILISLLKSRQLAFLKVCAHPRHYKDLTYDQIKHILRSTDSKEKVTENRYKFFKRKQREGESISEFIVALKSLAIDCLYGKHEYEDMVRDAFINGLRSRHILNKVIEEKAVSLEKTIKIALDVENSENDGVEGERDAIAEIIDMISTKLSDRTSKKLKHTPTKFKQVQYSSKNIRHIDPTIDGCQSDKLKVNLPDCNKMMECVVELRWYKNASTKSISGILKLLTRNGEITMLKLDLTEVTSVMDCCEPGQPCCAIYTAKTVGSEVSPLKLYFSNEDDFQNWFSAISRVLHRVNHWWKIPQDPCIWSTSTFGDIYITQLEPLGKSQTTIDGAYVKVYDCKDFIDKPYRIELLNNFPVKSSITVHGYVPPDADRFYVNLVCGNNNDIAFHFNPRYDQQQIVRNTYTEAGYWGPEEREGKLIIEKCSRFTLTIICQLKKFTIYVNGLVYANYHHRLSPDTITDVEIGGDVHVSSILYQSKEVIMHLPDLKWRKIFGNLWKVETCSASVTWGIGYDYLPSVFMLNSVRRFKKKDDDDSSDLFVNEVDFWRIIEDTKVKDLSLCVLDDTTDPKTIAVWAVSINGHVLYRSGVTTDCVVGEKWEHVPTDQSIKCITAGGTRQVWCCGENGICYWRFGITATNPIGERWESVESMDGRFFEKIAIGNFVVWALESTGELFIRKESIPDIPASALWHKVKNFDRMKFKHISTNGEHVWAVSKDGFVHRRLGISDDHPEGVSWTSGSPGNFLHFSE